MDQQVRERFERIEADLAAVTAGLVVVQQSLTGVVQSQMGLQEMLADFARTVASYTEASEVRMKRMEENLDALIRAITAEHTNGRGKGR